MTMPTTFGLDLASASFKPAGENTSPQGLSTIVTFAPARAATSLIRWPKTPLAQTIMLSPGSIRFTTVASMPAEPVALTANVIGFRVRNTCRSISWRPFISSR